MKAMILAAGLGTRLRPLTRTRPKALVPIGNVPMIDRVIAYLKGQGIEEIVVNAHHHADQIVRHLQDDRRFGVRIEVRVESDILGTGGGVKNAADFWDQSPFILVNSDILTDIDLHAAYKAHLRRGSLATMILHERIPYNQVKVGPQMDVLDISKQNTPGRLAFTGIHVISPELLALIPAGVFYDIIECYRKSIQSGKPVRGYKVEGHDWLDIGTIESYLQANEKVLGRTHFLTAPGSFVAPSARLEDWAVIGAGARVEAGAEIRRSVLWENVQVKEGIRVVDSVVSAPGIVDRDLLNTAL